MSSTQSTKLPQHEATEAFSKISDLTVNPLQHVPLTKYDGGAIKQVDLAAQPAVDELKWDEVQVPQSHEHDVATTQSSNLQDAKLKAGEKWEQAKVGANDLLESGKEKAAEISAIAGQKFEQTKDSLRSKTTSSSTSTGPSTSDKLKSKAADVQESAIAAKDASMSKMTAVKDDMMDKAAQLQKSASDKTAELKQSANEKAAVVGAKATELKDASMVKATELKNTTAEKSVAAKDSTVSGLQSAKESTISNLQYAKDMTTEKLMAAKDLVSEKVAMTKDTTIQAVHDLQAKTNEQLLNVKAKVTELTHKSSTPTSTTTESAPSTTSNLLAKASDLMHMGVDKTTAAFHTVSEKMGLAGASTTSNSAAASDLKEIAELAKGGNASVLAGSSDKLSTHTTVRSTTEFDTPSGVTRTDEFKEFKDGKLVDASAKTLKADKPML